MRRLGNAKLRQVGTIENVDYCTGRGLDVCCSRPSPLANGFRDRNYLRHCGPTGTGKSRLACALGNGACRNSFAVFYKRLSRMFAELAQARAEARLARLIAALERVDLLVLDLCGAQWRRIDGRRPEPLLSSNIEQESQAALDASQFAQSDLEEVARLASLRMLKTRDVVTEIFQSRNVKPYMQPPLTG